jgi:deoxynucleoside triphosphate triphosphohydrolase SAMHD1
MELLLSKDKIFSDVIHNSIETTKLAKLIIDSEIFQRLRHLNQLGCCSFVYPNANNKRFEHSIGVYHLAGKLIGYLIKNSNITDINNELIEIPFIKTYLSKKHSMSKDGLKFFASYKNETLFDEYLIEIIKIAGLIHDLGHGPFSHLFDTWLKNDEEMSKCKFLDHEERSKELFKEILETRTFKLGDKTGTLNDYIEHDAFEFICELIEPNETTPDNFIFQIISNAKNGFDVDKLDYILRDSYYLNEGRPYNLESILSQCKITKRKMCFPEKYSYEINKVYRARYDLHKGYYCHKTVISIEFIIIEILKNINILIGIKEDLLNSSLEKFKDLNDNTILSFTKNLKLLGNRNIDPEQLPYIEKIDSLINDLNYRNIAKCIYIKSEPLHLIIHEQSLEHDEHVDDSTLQSTKPLNTEEKLIKHYCEKYKIKKSKIKIVKKTIGYVSSEKSHPLDNIYFYNKENKAIIISKDNISMCVPFTHVERLYIIYKLTDNLC